MSEKGNNVPVMVQVEAQVDGRGVLIAPVQLGSLKILPPTSTPYHRIIWRTHTGQRKQTTRGRTFQEASKAADSILDDLESGTERGGELVKEMIENYLREDRIRRQGRVWSDNTHSKTSWLFAKFVTPVIGHIRCRSLTNKALIAVVEQKPVPTTDTQRRIRAEIRRLVYDGYEQGFLSTPPEQLLRGVKSAGQGKRGSATKQGEVAGLKSVDRKDLPTPQQIADLAEAVSQTWRDGRVGEAFIYLAAYSGLRLGELLAVRDSDIDCTRRRIHVERQVLADGGTITPPKGHKTRIAVFPRMTPPTKQFPNGYPLLEKVSAVMKIRNGADLVFPSPRGFTWNHSNFYERVWLPAYEKAEWPGHGTPSHAFTFHTLRHVAAVYWLWDQGKSARAVSDVLGHGSTQITLNVYGERGDRLQEFDS